MEDLLLNITGISGKMKVRPKGQKLHNFFKGNKTLLTAEQIMDVDAIVSNEYSRVKKFLNESKRMAKAR